MPRINDRVKITSGRTLGDFRSRGGPAEGTDLSGATGVVISDPEKAVLDGKEEVAVCITDKLSQSRIVTVPTSQVKACGTASKASASGFGPGTGLPPGCYRETTVTRGKQRLLKQFYDDGRVVYVPVASDED